jgi:hypothetical protein
MTHLKINSVRKIKSLCIVLKMTPLELNLNKASWYHMPGHAQEGLKDAQCKRVFINYLDARFCCERSKITYSENFYGTNLKAFTITL